VQAIENFQAGPRLGRLCGTLSGANHSLFCWESNFNLADLMEEQQKYAIPHTEWHLDMVDTESSTE